MDTQPQCHLGTRQSIQTRLSERHTDGKAHQNRTGCKRQHVVRILYWIANRELCHRISRNDDDDALGGEGGETTRPSSRRLGSSIPMDDHATSRRPHAIREHRDKAMPIHAATRLTRRTTPRRKGATTDPRRIQENKAIPRTTNDPRRSTETHPRIPFLILHPTTPSLLSPRTLPAPRHTLQRIRVRLLQHHHRHHQRHRRLYGRHHRPRHRPPHNDNRRRTQARGNAVLINGLCAPNDPSTQKQRKSRRLRDLHRQ